MATPTPMKHAPSQQGRTPSQTYHGTAATPPVSTPFSATQGHAAFSPHGHKSSPQHYKRSPATLMGHPSNPPVNFDSPTAAALGALGIGNGLEIGLDHVGVGGLGGLPGDNDVDERAKRLHQLLAMFKETKGRVSEAGLERLVKSIGLECLWASAGGNDKAKTLIIAGSALSVDIVMSNNIVQQVTLSFPDSADIVSKHVEQAGRILLDDLKLAPNESPLTKMLDKFAVNLDRLALLDRLSVIPGFNCHEAIAGIHESFERLHHWDLMKLRTDPAMADRSDDYLLTTAMCSRHGLPGMHKRDRVGMTLEYWRERHFVPASSPGLKQFKDETERTWAVWVGCAPLTAMGHQPARVSSAWLSEGIEKADPMAGDLLLNAAAAAGQPILDWLQPPNTFLPPSEDDHKMGMDPAFQASKLPEVIFTAEFDPPVIMPLHEWDQIHQLTHAPPSTEFSLATFDSLIFPVPPRSHHDPSETRTIVRLKEVPIFGRVGESSSPPVIHRNTLFIYKPVYGRTLTSVPFSHPSQLIDVLPRLRQYAFLSTLLEKSFGSSSKSPSDSAEDDQAEGAAANGGAGKSDAKAKLKKNGASPSTTKHDNNITTTTRRHDFAKFMAGEGGSARGNDDNDGTQDEGMPAIIKASPHSDHVEMDPDPEVEPSAEEVTAATTTTTAAAAATPLKVDVTLTVHPVPRLQVVFPFRGATATIVLDIQLNGMVHIISQNVLPDEVAAAAGGGVQPQDLGRVLQICEHLGEWCEWIRSRLE